MAEPSPEKEIEEPYELPDGWAWCKLGDVNETTSGGTPKRTNKDYYGGDIPWLKSGELEDNVITKAEETITELGLKKSSAKIFPTGTLLIALYGATVGKTGKLAIESATNQAICGIFNDDQVFYDHYLWHYLISFRNNLIEKSFGRAQPNISQGIIQTLKVPISPLNEQHRIVTKLETLLAKVNRSKDHLAKVPPLIKRFRQSVLAAACSGRLTEDWRREHPDVESASKIIEAILQRRLKQANTPTKKQKIKDIYSHREEQASDLLPQSWEYAAINKLCESFQYGTSKKSMPVGKIPVLRMGNIQNGEIDWNDLVYTSDEGEIEKYRLEPETVLFNRTNSPELVGKTAIYRGENPAIFAGYLIRINNYKELDSEYLNYCLNTSYTKERCLKVKTDGVSQSNINAQKLGKFEITFCPLEEQQEIVRRVDVLFKNIGSIEDHYKKANAQVDNLTQSILARAFRGELVSQDPNDEPASVLLERIKQARAELEAKKKTQKRKSKTMLDFN